MKGYIYKLVCNLTGKIYYGSTIRTLKRRLQNHKSLKDCSCREIIENGDYIMILLETIEFEDKKQLLIREKYYIDNHPCINQFSPLRTEQEKKEYKKEYSKLNKEKIKEKNKEWRENNKEQISEKNKDYYENNKERIIEKNKEYRENNKEYYEEYYETNKEQIREKKKRKITCECGSFIRKDILAQHKRTKKHIKYLDSINENN